MSIYATIGGELRYDAAADFEAAVERVRPWLDSHLRFVSEDGRSEADAPDIDTGERTIRIPVDYYRNLIRVLDDICVKSRGRVVWFCTDGCFHGGVYTDGVEKVFDLFQWGAARVLDEHETIPSPEGDMGDFFDFLIEVEHAFFQRFYWDGAEVPEDEPGLLKAPECRAEKDA